MNLFSDKYLPWFILKEIPDLGNQLYKRLIHQFLSPENILTAPTNELAGIIGISTRIIKEIQGYKKYLAPARTELNQIHHHQIKIVTMTDPDYPPLLKQICDPPPYLTYMGTLDAQAPCISIVGSRKATAYGLDTAKNLACSMASNGFQVVSGMALGIDSAAHEGALKAGGKTIAILGSGLNRIYPRENKGLFSMIRQNGTIMSEFKIDSIPFPYNFPIRNRVIAGLSTGTLVVEAEKRSGSLITARLAGEYNREVFAVPGSIKSKKSQGTHSLLKQGAKLVENEMDILDELHQFVHAHPHAQPSIPEKKIKKVSPLIDKNQRLVYKHLDPYPKHIDLIIKLTRMDSGFVTADLLDLELKGLVQRHPGNYFSLSEE
ncbi:MAG: DNA-protecting protein DprA [Desulfobacteraceae bacterium]|nr:DNA-protecting protein DprA [Desulfobacteraceae bacterium]